MFVSIPFIAGQWSLRCAASPTPVRPARFNPLHCGAVVASRRSGEASVLHAVFQSPSLRGSGRFSGSVIRSLRYALSSFNPLHCGAVVASLLSAGVRSVEEYVSIPFIAGQWSLLFRDKVSNR